MFVTGFAGNEIAYRHYATFTLFSLKEEWHVAGLKGPPSQNGTNGENTWETSGVSLGEGGNLSGFFENNGRGRDADDLERVYCGWINL